MAGSVQTGLMRWNVCGASASGALVVVVDVEFAFEEPMH